MACAPFQAVLAACGALVHFTLGIRLETLEPAYTPRAQLTGDGPGPVILVSSTGGLGTTTFMQEMNTVRPPLYLNNYEDRDNLKHTPWRKIWQGSKTVAKMQGVKKIIYLHGEIVRSILSLSRRGYMHKQAGKLRTDPAPGGVGPNYPTLKEYVDRNDDYFQLEDHFNGFWYQCQYPIAFLDMTKKTENLQQFGAWLGVDPDELARRLTPWRSGGMTVTAKESAQQDVPGGWVPKEGDHGHEYSVSSEIMGKLQAKLAAFSGRLEKLGGLYIRNGCTPDEKVACEAWMASYMAGPTNCSSPAAASAPGLSSVVPAARATAAILLDDAAAPIASRSSQSARKISETPAARKAQQARELSQSDPAAKRRIENNIEVAVEEELAAVSPPEQTTG